jgi:hypothetical protein
VTAAQSSGSGSTRTAAVANTSLSGLTVTIAGTNLTTVVDGDGNFQLTGVPPGMVRLLFKSITVDAATDLPNVAPQQFIEIVVQVSPTSAVLVNDARSQSVTLCHKEGNGTYHSIEISQSAELAHRNHGDGKVGDPVPGQPGRVFDSNCQVAGPSIDIEKFTNGEDADRPTGPRIAVGSAVLWQYVVTNTGTLALTGVVVVDDKGVSVTCPATTLAVGAAMTCTANGLAVAGQYTNLGSVSASWTNGSSSGSVTDSDRSHYFGVAPDAVDNGGGATVALCHRTGNGRFVSLTVSVSAEPAHRAHGDGAIGEAVPNQPGKVFGAGCSVL